MKWNSIILIITCLISYSIQIDNGLGLTPAMGWNSWNFYGCNINEEVIKKTADLMVSKGLKDAGYEYLNLDDCWQMSRDENGRIVEDKEKFPSGMKELGKYIHSKGLKFGIYSSAGTKTCQGRPGSLYYEDIDAQTYAEWEVDYLKYDNCHNQGIPSTERYPKMTNALKKAGRPIYYSICQWGEEKIATWGSKYSNSWRTTLDISNNWESFILILDQQQGLEKYAGPGGWNDPDMLEVGNDGFTLAEAKSHFVLWAVLKAPLILGNDLSNMSPEILQLLTNDKIIKVNQDKKGKQAKRIKRDAHIVSGYLDYYVGELERNTWVVVYHNRSKENVTMELFFKEFDFPGLGGDIVDIINKNNIGYTTDSYSVEVESHGVFAYTIHLYCGEGENCKKFLE